MRANERIRIGQIVHLREGQQVFLSVPGSDDLPLVVREVICASLKTGQPPRAKVETEDGLQAIVPQHELLVDIAAAEAA